MEKRAEAARRPRTTPRAPLTADEAAWEATRLNIILANKGYSDSDVTRWWNFTRHRELDDQTIAEAWRDGRYSAVSRLIQSLPDKHVVDATAYPVDESGVHGRRSVPRSGHNGATASAAAAPQSGGAHGPGPTDHLARRPSAPSTATEIRGRGRSSPAPATCSPASP